MKRLLVLGLTATAALAGCANLTVGDTHTDGTTYKITERVSTLDVDNEVGRVTVKGADVDVITVRQVTDWSRYEPTATHEVVDGRLVLTGRCPGDQVRCSVTFEVTAPASIAAKIRTDVAAVSVTGLDGAVSASSDTGAITLTELGGRLTASADTGAVVGSGLRSQRADVRTDTGRIALGFASPPSDVDASTDVGAVELSVPSEASYDVDASADTGQVAVTVRTDASSDHHLTARAGTGSVAVKNS